MDRLNLKLLSMVLLGALLLMMVHNIVPHTHHDHGDFNTSLTHSSHHHQEHDKAHEHSHPQNSEEDGDDGFLFLFFVHHYHSSPNNDFIAISQIEQTFQKKKHYSSQLFLHSAFARFNPSRKQIGSCFEGHERFNTFSYLTSSSPRAPPYLG